MAIRLDRVASLSMEVLAYAVGFGSPELESVFSGARKLFPHAPQRFRQQLDLLRIPVPRSAIGYSQKLRSWFLLMTV